MRQHDKHAGAGGFWIVQNEVADQDVVAQAGVNNCCAACIQMVMAARGIRSEQEAIALQIGIPTATNRLAPALNNLDSEHNWEEGFFVDFSAGLAYLMKRVPWIAFMKDFGARFLHAVVVDGTNEEGHVMIRDPWPPGTSYTMTSADFSDACHGWTGMAVYLKRTQSEKAI